MRRWWEAFRLRLLVLVSWHKPPPALPEPELLPELAPLPGPEPLPEPASDRTRYSGGGHAADVEEAGRWYFRRDILDRLDAYFEVLGHMRRTDPRNYALYRRVGALIINRRTLMTTDDAIFDGPPNKWRSFGAVLMGEEKNVHVNKKMVTASFIYFQRVETLPPEIEQTHDGVYLVTLFYIWAEKHNGKLVSTPLVYAVAIDTHGRARMLKVRHRHSQQLPRHRGTIGHTVWSYPGWTNDIADDHHETPRAFQHSLVNLFMGVYAWCDMAQADVRVAVTQGGETAAFSVDLLRMPYFFKDRDKVSSAPGLKAKRIFHIVRVHHRANGSSVLSHFRGLRDFMWHGRKVHISMAGTHHTDLRDFDGAANFIDHRRRTAHRWITVRKMAKVLQRHLNH
jgi:hypothetical protein